MSETQGHKYKILIVDDSEMNRAILADILGEEYDIIEAENGVEAVSVIRDNMAEISLILLDIVMPELDGFGVLQEMNNNSWIEDIPVIMISSENSTSYIEKAYELGVTDFISRPFDVYIVHKRVNNTILLYAKQKRLMAIAAEQIYEKEQQSNLMIDILSHIVEFRNGESSMHVRNVHTITELLLVRLVNKTNIYNISRRDISIISTASALHDIGKIAVPEEVLNKPGRLTSEEFEIMKTHSMIGANMLEDLPIYQGDPLVKTAYDICRWHHERYDGKGYPDGLKGDEIPISAQIVSLADVYDALTSERVYKKAIPHDTAIKMILDGQCGAFNPLILECLTELAGSLQENLKNSEIHKQEKMLFRDTAEELAKHAELTGSDRTLKLLEHERIKQDFYAELTKEIQFEFSMSPLMVTLSPFGAAKLGLPETIMDPINNSAIYSIDEMKDIKALSEELRGTSPGHPRITRDYKMKINGEERWFRLYGHAFWSSEEPPRYTGAIGKFVDINESKLQLAALERQASIDTLTGLLNHATAKSRIKTRLEERPEGHYALAIFDLDLFKEANDTYGHLFGDKVLIHTANQLSKSIRGGDIVARIGGDEFLLFLEYKTDLEPVISRIFNAITGKFEDFSISLSMGVAKTDTAGTDYDNLFRAADSALYKVKQSERGKYVFYDNSMKDTISAISPIDGGFKPEENKKKEK